MPPASPTSAATPAGRISSGGPGASAKDIYLKEGTGYCTGSPLTFELVLQGDGNLVIYNSSGHALWATGTRNSGAYLCFQNDGNLVVYTGVVVGCDGYPIWATGT